MISENVSVTVTIQLLINHTPKMTKDLTEINGISIFLKFGIVKLFKKLPSIIKLLPQIKAFE